MRIFFSALPIVIAGHAGGQASWMHTYGESNGDRHTFSALEHANGDLYFISMFPYATPDLRLVRADPQGDTMATRAIDLPGSIYGAGFSHSLIELMAGDLLQVGTIAPNFSSQSSGHMVWFNEALDTLRTVMVSDSVDVNAVVERTDSTLACFGWRYANGPKFWWTHLNADGSLIEERSYPSVYDEICYSGCSTPDGGYMLCGVRTISPANDDILIRKLAADGSQEWSHAYGSAGIDNSGFVTALEDTTYLIACGIRPGLGFVYRAALKKVDAAGDPIWTTLRSVDEPSSHATCPVIDEQGRIVAAGARTILGIQHGLMMAYSPSGQVLWERIFIQEPTVSQVIYDLRATNDGGYLLAGHALDAGSGNTAPWLIRVDSMGCLVPGCHLFDGIQEQIISSGIQIGFTPNPADGTTEVEVVGMYPGLTEPFLRVVRSDGTELRVGGTTQVGNGRIQLNTSTWTSGLYHIHLVDGNRWVAGGKLIVDHR